MSVNNLDGWRAELKGHFYDCDTSQSDDQFVQTTERIESYVARNFKNGGDIAKAILKLEKPTLVVPPEPTDFDDDVEKLIWESTCKLEAKMHVVNNNNIQVLYCLLWGQCSERIQQQLKSLSNYGDMKKDHDGIALLIAIKCISYGVKFERITTETLNGALCRLLSFRQGENMSLLMYYEHFNNLIDVYTRLGGSKEPDPGVLQFVAGKKGWSLDKITDEQKAEALEMSRANLFIIHADRSRFGKLIITLQNDYVISKKDYPATLQEALRWLIQWNDTMVNPRNASGGGGARNGQFPRDKAHITCFKCQEKGHYAKQCPN